MTTWAARLRIAPGRNVRADLLVLGGLTSFVLVVYTVVVVAGGWLLGRTSLPGIPLAVVATAVVALAFDRVHGRFRTVADRAVGTAHLPPFEVLRQFSGAVTGQYAAEDVPAQMARVLAEGTGAAWTEVWLSTEGQLTLAHRWPVGAGDDQDRSVDPRSSGAPGHRWLEVRHGSG